MRLATFNLLHGRSVDDGRVAEDRLRGSVRRIDADVLCLQEVDRWQPRSHRFHLTQVVAQAMNADYWRFEPTLLGTPGGAWRPPDSERPVRAAGGAEGGADGGADGGAEGGTEGGATVVWDGRESGPEQAAYGLGLVSRLPVIQWHVVRFPAARVPFPVLLPGTGRPMLLADEPRAALAAVLSGPNGPFTVVCTHLSFVPGWNAWQLRRLTRGVAALPDPLILLGDLNLPGPLPRVLTGWTQLARVATYPSWAPRVQFDHVLDRDGSCRAEAVEAVRLPLSDHCALVVDTTLPARRKDGKPGLR